MSHFSVVCVLPFSHYLEDIILGLNRTGFSFGDIIFQRVHTIGHKMRFNKMPQYHELYPRDRTSNTGSVSIQGYALLNESDYEAVEINIFRERELLESTLLNLTYNNDTANFSYTHELPAELTNYHFKVYGIKNGVPHFEAEALNVVAGDVYLIDGGSNAAAVVLYDPADTIPHAYRYDRNPFIRNYGLKYADENSYVWHSEADDDAPFASFRSGQWGLRLGRNIVENQQIPIAIINGSASVASIEYLQPNWQNPTDTASNYGRLLTRVRNARLENHIRAILFFQG